MKLINWIAIILVIVGGLNWGLVGLFQYDLVTSLLGVGTAANVVFGLVGLSAILMIFKAKKIA